jgi:hypothetical protein
VTRRELVTGTELTIDYLINNQGGDSWPCRCGADRCRGETGKSFFSLPDEFQREYLPASCPMVLRTLREQDRPHWGIGHSSCPPAQSPSMGVVLNPYRGPVTGLFEWSGRALALTLD